MLQKDYNQKFVAAIVKSTLEAVKKENGVYDAELDSRRYLDAYDVPITKDFFEFTCTITMRITRSNNEIPKDSKSGIDVIVSGRAIFNFEREDFDVELQRPIIPKKYT